MPAITALAIDDGADTPVEHTFSPVTTNGSLAKWADRAPGIPAGYGQISHEVLPPNGNRTVHKLTMGYMIPVVEEVDGSDKVVRYSSGQVTLNIHPESTLQERKDLLAYIANSLADAAVVQSVHDVEPFY